MSKKIQQPNSRINITLELDTANGKQKKELPFKLLVLANYSRHKTIGPIAKRECINVNKSNFDKVMADLAPELNLTIENKIQNDSSPIKANLQFTKMRDFHPENIIRQVPELRQCYLMRELLKDIKAHLLDNPALRHELEKITQSTSALQTLQKQLNHSRN